MQRKKSKKELVALGSARLAEAKRTKSAKVHHKVKEFILETSRRIRTRPEKWSAELVIGLVEDWADEQHRSNTLSNKSVAGRLFLITRVLKQLNNNIVTTKLSQDIFSATVNRWSCDRIKGLYHDAKRKAIRLSMVEFHEIARHLAFAHSNNEHNVRLQDARHLVLAFCCSSAARVKDVYHLIPLDAKVAVINGVQVVKFIQRYSKSNMRGSRTMVITLFASPKKPWLCPVRAWINYSSKYELEPSLSILQLPNVGDQWRQRRAESTLGLAALSEAL